MAGENTKSVETSKQERAVRQSVTHVHECTLFKLVENSQKPPPPISSHKTELYWKCSDENMSIIAISLVPGSIVTLGKRGPSIYCMIVCNHWPELVVK